MTVLICCYFDFNLTDFVWVNVLMLKFIIMSNGHDYKFQDKDIKSLETF